MIAKTGKSKRLRWHPSITALNLFFRLLGRSMDQEVACFLESPMSQCQVHSLTGSPLIFMDEKYLNILHLDGIRIGTWPKVLPIPSLEQGCPISKTTPY